MKLTKENVRNLFNEYRNSVSINVSVLEDKIMSLDDSPEKEVVPFCVAEFYELYKSLNLQTILYHCDYSSSKYEDFRKWYLNQDGRNKSGRSNSQEIIARMYLYGYEIDGEPKYYWRKKRMYTTALDTRIWLVEGIDLKGALGKDKAQKITESKAKEWLDRDFDKFEKIDVEEGR